MRVVAQSRAVQNEPSHLKAAALAAPKAITVENRLSVPKPISMLIVRITSVDMGGDLSLGSPAWLGKIGLYADVRSAYGNLG